MNRERFFWISVSIYIVIGLCAVKTGFALDLTLAWDANTEPDLAGYKIYYDTDSGNPYNGKGAREGNSPIDVPLNQDEDPDPNVVQYTLRNLPNNAYYLAVTAYNAGGFESGYSNEVDTNSGTDTINPSIVMYPAINRSNNTIDVTYNEPNMQNATMEANYTFSPSLLFKNAGGSDDIAYIGNETYRLSIAFIPNYIIYRLTVTNITDQAGNPVMPNTININDDDGDLIAGDWESAYGVDDPKGDPDLDNLTNMEEYGHGTNPKNPDTDGDGLPDGWEVAYGLDPKDDNDVDGGNGDLDDDGLTNYEEYIYGSDPASNTSPGPTPPEVKETIPPNNSGNDNNKGVPQNASFAVLLEDYDGLNVKDPTSIKFTIDDGIHPAYERDLMDTGVIRLIKLTSDPDTEITRLWAVYDRSKDTYGTYEYSTDINIKVDAKDKRGDSMAQAGYKFKIISLEEYIDAQANLPPTITIEDTPSAGQTTISLDTGEGAKLVYDSSEPITPAFGPMKDVPELNVPGVTPVGFPLNLQPPTVFNHPVTLIVPSPEGFDVRDLNLYLYDGVEWVYACSSYNTGGVIQQAGEGWMVPGSMSFNNSTHPPTLQIQVHHFSSIQTGMNLSPSGVIIGGAETGGGGGGCFISTVVNDLHIAEKILLLILILGSGIIGFMTATKIKTDN